MYFSIIIPVYNVEKYLHQCLDSVVNQTYHDIEIIIINDGSTDNSFQIIKQYASQDKRIIVINQSNKGLSATRNMGLKIASGEYILFIDSDDYIDIKTCEYLYEVLKNNNNHMAVFGRYRFWDETNKKAIDTISPKNITYKTGEEYLYDAIDHNCFTASACNKVFKRANLDKYNFKFIEGILYEDLYFVLQNLVFSQNVAILNLPLYYYRQNRKGSIIYEIKSKDKDVLITIKKIEDFFKDQGKENELENHLLKKLIYDWVSNAVCFKYPRRFPLSRKANKIVKEVLRNNIFNKYVAYFAYHQKYSFKYKTIAWLSLNAYPIFVIFIYLYYKIIKPI